MTDEQLARLADDFWARAGAPAPFPRDLERILSWTAPVFVVRLRGLRPASARAWLWQRGTRLPLAVPDRPLDGCVVAYRGSAGLFLEARLGAEDGRVVLAHEFAHFLADYELPRARAVRRLGPSVLPALDGERPATEVEGLAAALAGVPLDVHVHYMGRGFDPGRPATDLVERTANELACELLAPRGEVLARARAGRLPDGPDAWQRLLAGAFGLPPRWAAAYAVRLLRQRRGGRSFSDILGI